MRSKLFVAFCLTAAVAAPALFSLSGSAQEKKKDVKDAKAAPAADAAPTLVPPEMFVVPEGWELTVWAQAPMFRKPTNIDFDAKGRLWLCEGHRYRGRAGREAKGDRIMVLEDSDADGKADKSRVFTQEPELVAPLGVAVIGNKIIIAQPPDYLVYTDVDGDAKFDPKVDKKEVLLTGFGGRNHDHSLHSTTVGPDGWWYFNTGNAGEHVIKDRSGKTVRSGSFYENRDKSVAGKPSDDGHVYVGAMAFRMRPDGTNLQVIGHNFRNSYEQAVTSAGDVFQNDNDDTSSARTAFLLEYGNAGFCSADGKRSWNADVRRGQKTPTAHWRQEDPGTMPAGDVYGAGAPTGIVFVEGDELGADMRGTLLSCETALNTIFAYKPEPAGAGYKMERRIFLTSNKERKFAGTDSTGGAKTASGGLHLHFRPSDIAVGPDGAIYIADWCDARTGGHQTLDEKQSGTIYRLAPKGFKTRRTDVDLKTVPGLIAALKSPAINVRASGFYGLVEKGESAVEAVQALLADANPYYRARATWVLSQLGPKGVAKVVSLLSGKDDMTRVVAFRAIRRSNLDVLKHAAALAGDPSAAVRREVALAMRDVPLKEGKDILVRLGEQFDGKDPWYLEALGAGCFGKEEAVWTALFEKIGCASHKWDDRFSGITWRLHPPQALQHLKARVQASALPYAERRRMMTAIAFIANKQAANTMGDFALELPEKGDDGELRQDAVGWVKNRHNNDWRAFDVLARLPKTAGGMGKPAAPAGGGTGAPLPKPADVLKLSGDVARGKELFHAKAKCIDCHKAGDVKGGVVGPELGQAGRKYSREVILDSILNPSVSIALGYEATVIQLQDGTVIAGIVVGEGDPILLRDAKGEQVAVAAKDVAGRKKSDVSIMPEIGGLGLTAQELADLVAYVESLK